MPRVEGSNPLPENTPTQPKTPKTAPLQPESLSPEMVAQTLRQQTPQESTYNPSEILETITNATAHKNSLEELFKAGRELTQTEVKLRELGDLSGLKELKALQVAYENKIAELYNGALSHYNKIVEKDIPKFEKSLEGKQNVVMRLLQPRSTQIATANKLINQLLDYQEIFNKLASCKDIGISLEGKEGVYVGQLGIIPDIHDKIQTILQKTSDDIHKVLSEWLTSPAQASDVHGGITNWGNGCYGISILQALGATQHFASLNEQPHAHDDTVLQKSKQIYEKVEGGQTVSMNESYSFFQTLFHKGEYNPQARKGGASLNDSLAQQDADDFAGYLLDRYNFHISFYNPADAKQRPQIETMYRIPLPRQSDIIPLQSLTNQVLTAPSPLLPVHISRFAFDKRGEKVDTPVDIPLDKPFLVKVKEGQEVVDTPYRLKSFVVHIGKTLEGGHYVAYRRNGDRWICCNDGSVTQASAEDVKEASKHAYSAFFELAK